MSTATLDHHHRPVSGVLRSAADCGARPGRPVVVPRPLGRVESRPNFALRRLVAGVMVVVVVLTAFVAVSTLSASLGGDPAVAAGTPPAVGGQLLDRGATPSMHVAVAGDTLWSIADTYRGEVGHARFVDALVRLNGGASIQVGQAVVLP